MKEGIPFEETKNEEVMEKVEAPENKEGGLEEKLKNIDSELEKLRSKLKTELKDAPNPDAFFNEIEKKIIELEGQRNKIVSELIKQELNSVDSKLDSYKSELESAPDPRAALNEILIKIIKLKHLKDDLLSKLQDYES